MADINAYHAAAMMTIEKLGRIKDPSSDDIRKTFEAVTATFRRSDGNGGVIDAPFSDVSALDREAALKSLKKESRRQAALQVMQKTREEAGLGPDPGERSTLSVFWDDLGAALSERNRRLGFTP